jgi:hypothetical protein
MPSYLLDKSVARRIVEALHHLDRLSYEEELVLELWRQLQDEQALLFIPTGVVNILQRFAHLVEIRTFLAAVESLESGRYLKRWARRLRRYNFAPEDALVLALATYGTDMDGNIMGVDSLITLDRPLLRNFQTHRAELQTRLRAMTSQLKAPYRHATLPKVLHPEEMLY